MNKHTYNIVISGLLTALSIALTRIFGADLLIAGVPASRLSVGFVPIILSGMISGPGWGFAVGGLADALGFLMFPKGTYFPPITLTSALVGFVPAIIVRYTGKTPDWLKILFSVFFVQIVCSIFLQTYWISLLNGKAFNIFFWPRAIVALATTPIYYLLTLSVYLGLKKANLLPKQKKTTEAA